MTINSAPFEASYLLDPTTWEGLDFTKLTRSSDNNLSPGGVKYSANSRSQAAHAIQNYLFSPHGFVQDPYIDHFNSLDVLAVDTAPLTYGTIVLHNSAVLVLPLDTEKVNEVVIRGAEIGANRTCMSALVAINEQPAEFPTTSNALWCTGNVQTIKAKFQAERSVRKRERMAQSVGFDGPFMKIGFWPQLNKRGALTLQLRQITGVYHPRNARV